MKLREEAMWSILRAHRLSRIILAILPTLMTTLAALPLLLLGPTVLALPVSYGTLVDESTSSIPVPGFTLIQVQSHNTRTSKVIIKRTIIRQGTTCIQGQSRRWCQDLDMNDRSCGSREGCAITKEYICGPAVPSLGRCGPE